MRYIQYVWYEIWNVASAREWDFTAHTVWCYWAFVPCAVTYLRGTLLTTTTMATSYFFGAKEPLPKPLPVRNLLWKTVTDGTQPCTWAIVESWRSNHFRWNSSWRINYTRSLCSHKLQLRVSVMLSWHVFVCCIIPLLRICFYFRCVENLSCKGWTLHFYWSCYCVDKSEAFSLSAPRIRSQLDFENSFWPRKIAVTFTAPSFWLIVHASCRVTAGQTIMLIKRM